MNSYRLFESSEVSVAMAVKSVVPGTAISPSVEDRVAAIRAKAAGSSAAHLQGTATASADRPAQVAWNDWKNE
jgi:hypothetical protein